MRWLIAALLLMTACTSVRPYKKVAADARVTVEKKAILAPFVSAHYPPQFRVVRDTIVRVDTVNNEAFVYELGKIIDSLIFLPKDTVRVKDPAMKKRVDSLIRLCGRSVIKTEVYTDTVYLTDAAKDMALSQFISSVQAENARLKSDAEDLKAKSSGATKKLRMYMIGMYAAIALALMFLFLLFKR